jgi:hypothetical protein
VHDITIPDSRRSQPPVPGSAPDSQPHTPPASARHGWLPGVIGPILAGAAAGVHVVLAGVLLAGLPDPDRDSLTQWGASFFIEDRDLPVFGAGVVAGLGLMLILLAVWNRLSQRPGRGTGRLSPGAWLAVKAVAALGGTLWFLDLWSAAREYVREGEAVPGGYLLAFALISAATLGISLLGSRAPAPARSPAGSAETVRRRLHPLDLVVPLAVVALVYVPEWRQLAGRFFVDESLFHWDFYAMSPTIAYHHGRALGAEVYSMYGVGWPMVFEALGSWLPISYGRMIQVGSIYSCIYLGGVYLLLRLLLRRPALAAFGTLLILSQFYLFMDEVNLWRFPSLTVMRWAFDVWCLIALVMHHRTGRRLWAAAAGAFIGLALAFSTDTGLYLAAAVTFYLLATLALSADKGRHWVDAAVTVLSATVVLLAALLLAARGQILTAGFWTGWLQALLEFGGGFAQLPMATVPNLVTVAGFAGLMLFYLTVIGFAAGKLRSGNAGYFEIFTGSVAVYGLFNLIHFVGRSGDYTPYRLWIPMAVIVVILVDRGLGAGPGWRSRLGAAGRPRVLVPAALALAVLVAAGLAAAPPSLVVEPVRNYPSLLSAVVNGSQPDGLCLLEDPRDLCGLPEEMEGAVNHFRLITGRIEGYAAQGKRVAVVDETGALFYLATGTPSFSRYPRIFIAMYNYEKAEEVRDELLQADADYILTRTRIEPPNFDDDEWPWASFGIAPASPHDESWGILNEVLTERYEREGDELAPFEMWRKKAPSGA